MTHNRLTKKLVKDALANTKVTILKLQDSTNPQTQEIVFKAKGREAAFEAVLCAMNGDLCLLHIYAQADKYDKPL